MKCGTCKGRKKLHVGNGIEVACPGCKGAGTVKMTIGDAVRAKEARRSQAEAAARSPSVLRFIIEGEPVPKGRPRFAPRKTPDGKTFVKPYTDAETAAYEEKVKLVAQVEVNRVRWAWTKKDRFTLIIKVFRTHYDAGGDIDNYEKAVMDAMNKVVYADDRYVRGKGSALALPDAARPRVEVEVRRFAMGSA